MSNNKFYFLVFLIMIGFGSVLLKMSDIEKKINVAQIQILSLHKYIAEEK